ncbi:MAG: HipA domain protein, partial [Verrucomicrobiales bacterium]|nr:HipA domain protein [Verrucomicrobiales bacterium]
SVAPTLDHGLDEMERLAANVIRTHGAIPGVQAKISLDFAAPAKAAKTGRLTLVGLWGRYILKPPTQAYPELPEVEDATMHLASAAGLHTVPHAMIRLKSGELAYITRRIDRIKTGKVAMEDLCQLTGRQTEDKYKGSLEQAGKVIRLYSNQPGLDAVDFFELVLFCFLTGNADMHLKNFSLWRPAEESVQLAPAYDLVATRLLLPGDDEESALALNGKKKNLRRKDFDALARSLELSEKVRDNAYLKMAKSKKGWSGSLEKGFLSDAIRKGYSQLIKERAGQIGLKA